MSEVSTILRSYEVRNENKNFKMIFHHQGTTWFANEVFFMDSVDKKLPTQITTKADAMKEIMKVLHRFNVDKYKTNQGIQRAQNIIKNRFENKIQDLFLRTFAKNNQSKLHDFAVDLNRILKENRYDFERIEMLKVLAKYKYLVSDIGDKKYVEELLKNKNLDITPSFFVSHFSLEKKWNKELLKSANLYKLSLTALGNRLAKSYQNAFVEILKEGYNDKQIESTIRQNTYRKKLINGVLETTNSYNNRIKTLTRTFSHGIDNLINFNQAEQAGITHYKYVGNPVPERDFCKQHYNKIYTIDEIQALNNGQGLDVLTYAGGYNCLHWWMPAGEGWRSDFYLSLFGNKPFNTIYPSPIILAVVVPSKVQITTSG